MKNIPLPKKFAVEEITKGKKAQITIEPCFPGYGLTLANSLRRVLLSSLPGGAVTAVKIKGVKHEFSGLENVSEDVLEIILNLKKLRFRVYTDEPVVLKVKVKGEKKITAQHIENSVDAEVINKDQIIATLNDDNSEVDMDLTVAKGIGYVTVEEQSKGKGEIGLILVDSIFTPVVNVGFNIEVTRVGQKTDYDKIVMTVETDGTITPEDAVKKAGEILTNQFNWIMEGGQRDLPEIDIEAPVILSEKEELPVIEAEESAVIEDSATVEAEAEDVPVEPVKKRGRPKKSDNI